MHPMGNVLLLNKPRGVTPLQLINSFKKAHPTFLNHTISYAGRLDPMAEGLLLLLVGEENKNREMYENLEKEYIFDLLPGITTDTYDVLGRITKVTPPPSPLELKQQLQSLLPSFLGQQQQAYPPYSSFHIKGKPLFYWARENKLDGINIPQREITIKTLSLKSVTTKATNELVAQVISDISRIEGEFRQKEAISDWRNLSEINTSTSYPLARIAVTCTSGTYIRSLAHNLGKKLSCGALAYRIQRTRVGEYSLSHLQRV